MNKASLVCLLSFNSYQLCLFLRYFCLYILHVVVFNLKRIARWLLFVPTWIEKRVLERTIYLDGGNTKVIVFLKLICLTVSISLYWSNNAGTSFSAKRLIVRLQVLSHHWRRDSCHGGFACGFLAPSLSSFSARRFPSSQRAPHRPLKQVGSCPKIAWLKAT